jgi:hypothetical protein
MLPGDTTILNPQKIMAHAHASEEMLIRLFYLRHGFWSFDATISLWLMTVGNLAMAEERRARDNTSSDEKQKDQSTSVPLSTIILCAKGMLEQGRNSYLQQAMFYAFRVSMNSEILELVDRHLQEPSSTAMDVVDEEFISTNLNSNLPINVVSLADDIKDKEIFRVFEDKDHHGEAVDERENISYSSDDNN